MVPNQADGIDLKQKCERASLWCCFGIENVCLPVRKRDGMKTVRILV